jgi:AraC family transcriptional regulator, regulatory protein of adaptative response / DNA-3-methyladenine glycosylase II
MRALGWPDAFPPGDVAVLKAMRGLPGMAPPGGVPAPGKAAAQSATRRAADASAQAWRPWRSYAVLRLWNSLGEPAPPPPSTQDTP